MLQFLIYTAKTAVVLAGFYMFYRILLSREKMHRFNRIVLILTAVASFALPLCVITFHREAPMDAVVPAVGSGPLAMALPSEASDWWITALAVLYFAGAAFVLARLAAALVSTVLVIKDARPATEAEMAAFPGPLSECGGEGCRVLVSDRALTPFSWMHTIVLPREDAGSGNPDILAHEKAHVAMRHSFDLLLVDILRAAQWFNPAMWMLRSDLAEIHEYQADDAVLSSGADIRNYQHLLVRKSVAMAGYTIVNSFNHSTLKNRINMMSKKNAPAFMAWKALYALPVVCLCLAANAKTVYVPAQQDVKVRTADGKQPLFVVDGKKISAEEFKKMDPSTIESVDVIKDGAKAMEFYGEDAKDGVVVVVTKAMAEKISAARPEPGNMDEVVVVGYGQKGELPSAEEGEPVSYSLIDVKPTFNGGDAAEFAKYVAQHLEYPKSCKEAKIQGKVMLSFTISSTGKVKDVRILRGSGSDELDAEAVRVVSSSPDWTPATRDGKPVPVTFTFPAIFSLR